MVYPYSSVIGCHRRAAWASRFMRPPGFFKRAEMRSKPRVRVGPFESPVKRFVRLREKSRSFSQLPPPRKVPQPKRIIQKLLKPIDCVPSVSTEALQRRLQFLLSDAAKLQQISAKMRPGLTPYQTELFAWERQMRDLRKVYRAQYLQKLAEVTMEESKRQKALFVQSQQEKQKSRAEARQRLLDDKKRRAILKDRLRIEQKLTHTILAAQQSNRKKRLLRALGRAQSSSDYITESNLKSKFDEKRLSLFDRNISIPDLLKHMGNNDEIEKYKIRGVNDIYQEILEQSFEVLPEDEPQFERKVPSRVRTAQQRAHLAYVGLTKEEKLKLLDEKIQMIRSKIDTELQLNADADLSLLRLLDQLEAVRFASQEPDTTSKITSQAMGQVDPTDRQSTKES